MITIDQLEPYLPLLNLDQKSCVNDSTPYYSICTTEFENALPDKKCSHNCPFISDCHDSCNLHSSNSPELVDIVGQLPLSHPELFI